jgi:hypothetical protein
LKIKIAGDARNISCQDEGVSFMDESITQQKRCSSCKETKPVSEFYRDKRGTHGYKAYCKPCFSARTKYKCAECQGIFRNDETVRWARNRHYCLPCYEMMRGQKKCIECNEIKKLEEFAEDKSRPDGHEYYCRACRKEHQLKKNAKAITKRGTKQCLDCRKVKDLSEFSEDHRNRDKLSSKCIECYNSIKQEKQVRDKTRDLAYKISKHQARHMRSRHRITEQEYYEMHEAQKGLCAICGRPELKSMKSMLCVDHNHRTGEIRGLLCNNCNLGIGYLEDNPEYLFKAIEYLQKHS